MNSRTHRILSIAAMLVVFSVCVKAQQKKNILHVHFQVRHFTDSLLKADLFNETFLVTYRLECNRPPCFFHGFQTTIVFDRIKLNPPGDHSAVFDGSACANASITSSAYDPSTGTYTVYADEPKPGMLDTSNHLLFSFPVTIKLNEGDSGLIEPSLFDVLKSSDTSINSNIDTVIIDNAAGMFSDGTWYPFAIAYLDSTPVVRKTYSITLASDSIAIAGDSTRQLPLLIKNADSAVIKDGMIRMILDTAVIEIKNIAAGPMLHSATLSSKVSGDTLMAAITSATALAGSDTAMVLTIHAKPRHDTLCAMFAMPMLSVTNSDNAVSHIYYALGPVCVFGEKQDTTSRIVGASETNTSFTIQMLGDHTTLSVRTTGENDLTGMKLQIFSVAGDLLKEYSLNGKQEDVATGFSSGTYVAIIEDATRLPKYEQKFSVVH